MIAVDGKTGRLNPHGCTCAHSSVGLGPDDLCPIHTKAKIREDADLCFWCEGTLTDHEPGCPDGGKE